MILRVYEERCMKNYNVSSQKFNMIKKRLESLILPAVSKEKKKKDHNDGLCVVNALRTAMLKKQTIRKVNDDLSIGDEYEDWSLDKSFVEILKKYTNRLKRLRLDNYETLIELCKDLLLNVGVIFNIFQYSSTYISTPLILKTDYDQNEIVKNVPISYLYPVFIGAEELSVRDLESKKITDTLNLVYDADCIPEDYGDVNDLEIEMKYITDIDDFFKIVNIKTKTTDDSINVKTTFALTKTYLCDRCFQLWPTRKKDRYEKHKTVCVGKYCVPLVVSDSYIRLTSMKHIHHYRFQSIMILKLPLLQVT